MSYRTDIMKKLKSLCYSIVVCCLFSCGSSDALFTVDTFTDFTVTLGLNTIEAHYFVNQNVPVTLQTQLDNLNFTEDDIMMVVSDRATLYPKFNANIDLDFINDVNVYLLDPDNFNKRTEIFYREFIPGGSKSEIQLLSNIPDITDYLLDDKVIVEVRLELRRFPPSTFDVRLDMSFGVFIEE